MSAPRTSQPDEALHRFLRRVWSSDVVPLLRGERAEQRRKSARIGGKVAATGGLLVDALLRLRGRPFTRALAVLGSSFGAMLPDVWDWEWIRGTANARQRRVVTERVQQQATALPEAEALELFGLPETATHDQLKAAWRSVSKRWHPDLAPDEHARNEYHIRFVAYSSAYELLESAYEQGRLPLEH